MAGEECGEENVEDERRELIKRHMGTKINRYRDGKDGVPHM